MKFTQSAFKADFFHPIVIGQEITLSTINFVVTSTPPSTRMHRNTLSLPYFVSVVALPAVKLDKQTSWGIMGKTLPCKTNAGFPFDSNC
jgi:hypothetical protein